MIVLSRLTFCFGFIFKKFIRILKDEFIQKGWKSKECIVLQASKLSTDEFSTL